MRTSRQTNKETNKQTNKHLLIHTLKKDTSQTGKQLQSYVYQALAKQEVFRAKKKNATS